MPRMHSRLPAAGPGTFGGKATRTGTSSEAHKRHHIEPIDLTFPETDDEMRRRALLVRHKNVQLVMVGECIEHNWPAEDIIDILEVIGLYQTVPCGDWCPQCGADMVRDPVGLALPICGAPCGYTEKP